MRISRAQLYSLLRKFENLPGGGEGVLCCPGVVGEDRTGGPFPTAVVCVIDPGGSAGAEG